MKWILAIAVALLVASPAGAYRLGVSAKPDRSRPAKLGGKLPAGRTAYVFTSPDKADIATVDFTLDGTVVHTEKMAPYDFAGTSGSGTANPWTVPKGRHTMTAKVNFKNGTSATTRASFTGTGASAPAACGTQRTLTGFQSAGVLGNRYRVQANEWGSSAPFSITNDGCANFRVATSQINVPTDGAPGAYPSLYRGCHWGSCTANSGLPSPVGKVRTGTVKTSIAGSLVTTGAWNYAYDIWFNTASQTTNNSVNGLEMMVWLAKNGPVQPAGAVVARNALMGGRSYTVWKGGEKPGGTVSYVLTTPVTTLTNLDLGALAADSVARGYMTDAWWLIDVEAGFEPWQGGGGLTVTSFKVCTAAGC